MAFVHVILFSVIKMVISRDVEYAKHMDRNTNMCKMFSRNPFFESELVLGSQWRIYYSWNVQIGSKCVDISFKNATKEIVHRVWSDMNEYLEMQPNWEAAALLLNIGSSRREVMLFMEQGPSGGFIGVPNIVRDGNIPPLRKSVSLIKFHMKLVDSARYLVVMDCQLGVASLSARSTFPVKLADIRAVAIKQNLGEGHPACTIGKDNEEQLMIKQYA